jgi:GTP cyclohydrolase II
MERRSAVSSRTLPTEIARLTLPTAVGEFDARAFEAPGGVHVCLSQGHLDGARGVLVRLHSECLTGDSLGSLRCDCGIQLRHALRSIAVERRGVLVYSTGHEGRGIGLANKLRAYMLQDRGLDTVEANVHLGFGLDERSFDGPAACLHALGLRSIRLMTNNPEKVAAVRSAGIDVDGVGAATAAHVRNQRYLTTKQTLMGHLAPMGAPLTDGVAEPRDIGSLLGAVETHGDRPHVVVKYAQTLDGRIATKTGDSRWISGQEERRAAHALRSACDAVLVGVGTVLRDDPLLTVRMVPGATPIRVVLDSTLRIPDDARILGDDAATLVLTTDAASMDARDRLRRRGVSVVVVEAGRQGIDLRAALRTLLEYGVRSLLVEGGARVITSFLSTGAADRLIVGIAPRLVGAGTDAVNDLGITGIEQAMRIERRTVHALGDDVLIAGDVARPPNTSAGIRS